jgi:hypothetical protein
MPYPPGGDKLIPVQELYFSSGNVDWAFVVFRSGVHRFSEVEFTKNDKSLRLTASSALGVALLPRSGQSSYVLKRQRRLGVSGNEKSILFSEDEFTRATQDSPKERQRQYMSGDG